MVTLSAITDKQKGTAGLLHKGNTLGLHFFMETEYLLLFLSPLAPDTLTLCPPNLITKQFKGRQQQRESRKGKRGRLVQVKERFGMLSPFVETHQIRERGSKRQTSMKDFDELQADSRGVKLMCS